VGSQKGWVQISMEDILPLVFFIISPGKPLPPWVIRENISKKLDNSLTRSILWVGSQKEWAQISMEDILPLFFY
jgi:hypothetical protein